jgi:putative membrane protein
VVIIAVALVSQGASSQNRTSELIRLGVVIFFVLLSAIYWFVTRWRVAEGAVQIETGLLRRSSLRLPLQQIQAIDIVRPGLARIFGLAELRVRMASGSRSTGRLAYMRESDAEAVRAHLLQLSQAQPQVDSSPGAGATPPPPTSQQWAPLFMVNDARLAGSILLSGPALVLFLIISGLAVTAVLAPGATGGVVAGFLSSLIALAGATWTRFNGLYGLSLGTGPDGLHVRSGLIQTSAETIPWGRIQALRTVQPLLWRPFGWYRVEADVAGHNISGRRDRAAKRAGRALIPVGTWGEVQWLADLVMPGTPEQLARPPRRVVWKAPLRYRRLAYASNEQYAVTTSGRFRRVTDRVPLAKIQSIRWTEGPVQRRLGLASVHLDTAGRSVFAVARDRDAAEAGRILTTLPEACRRARSAAMRTR